MANIYKDLERLSRLHKDGAITAAEFEQEKAKLLNDNQQRNKTADAAPRGQKKDKHTVRFNVSLSIPAVGQLLSNFNLGGQKKENSLASGEQRQEGLVLMNPILLIFIYILLITLLLNTFFDIGNIILIGLAVIALLVGLYFIIRLIDKAIKERKNNNNSDYSTIHLLDNKETSKTPPTEADEV
jgi:hypothetical protein